MAKSKAAKQRKKAALATPSVKTGSQPGNKKLELLNDTKAQGFQKRAQKPFSTTSNQTAPGLPKTKHKPSVPKQTAAPDPGNTKTCAKFEITQNPAIPFSIITLDYSDLQKCRESLALSKNYCCGEGNFGRSRQLPIASQIAV